MGRADRVRRAAAVAVLVLAYPLAISLGPDGLYWPWRLDAVVANTVVALLLAGLVALIARFETVRLGLIYALLLGVLLALPALLVTSGPLVCGVPALAAGAVLWPGPVARRAKRRHAFVVFLIVVTLAVLTLGEVGRPLLLLGLAASAVLVVSLGPRLMRPQRHG